MRNALGVDSMTKVRTKRVICKKIGWRYGGCGLILVINGKNFPKKFGSSEKMLTFALAKQK